jgi:hypothetical protein
VWERGRIGAEGTPSTERFAIGVALALLAVGAMGAGPAARDAEAACTAPVKSTAYDNPADQDDYALASSGSRLAQSFTVPAPITLNKVTVDLLDNGATGPVTVQIRADAGGVPGAVLATRSGSPVNTSYLFVGFDFSADHLTLAEGVPYYVVAYSEQGSPLGYRWALDTSSPTYPEGNYLFSLNSGADWAVHDYDFLFQVFGQTCTADTQTLPTDTPTPPAAASGLAFSHTAFAAEPRGPSATGARTNKPPRGTNVSFTLNEAASVGFTVTRRARGRKAKRGKKRICVKPTRTNRTKKKCIRVVTLKGGFLRAGIAGTNRFHFTGRLNGRKLKPGRYRLVATPTAAGHEGKPASSAFRIVR